MKNACEYLQNLGRGRGGEGLGEEQKYLPHCCFQKIHTSCLVIAPPQASHPATPIPPSHRPTTQDYTKHRQPSARAQSRRPSYITLTNMFTATSDKRYLTNFSKSFVASYTLHGRSSFSCERVHMLYRYILVPSLLSRTCSFLQTIHTPIDLSTSILCRKS